MVHGSYENKSNRSRRAFALNVFADGTRSVSDEPLLSGVPAVGIIGPRQVGKTTLAKQIMQIVESDTLYLDLENEIDVAKLSNPTLFLQLYQDVCVVIDFAISGRCWLVFMATCGMRRISLALWE